VSVTGLSPAIEIPFAIAWILVSMWIIQQYLSETETSGGLVLPRFRKK
jgi:hypothetical protein